MVAKQQQIARTLFRAQRQTAATKNGFPSFPNFIQSTNLIQSGAHLRTAPLQCKRASAIARAFGRLPHRQVVHSVIAGRTGLGVSHGVESSGATGAQVRVGAEHASGNCLKHAACRCDCASGYLRLRRQWSTPCGHQLDGGIERRYIYDALGNLYAINSVAASQLSVFAFTPESWPSGPSIHNIRQGFQYDPDRQYRQIFWYARDGNLGNCHAARRHRALEQ